MSDVWKSYWPIFEKLEGELCELTFAVAFVDRHLDVYSNRVADLLLRTGAECENVGKALCLDRNLVSNRQAVRDFNFPQIGDAICSQIPIQTKQLSIIWPYQSLTATLITPFATWGTSGSTNPDWFNAYNGIKHDRIGRVESANVHNTIHALGGLFILNLWLREADIVRESEHFNLAQRRITAYSKFFSPGQFLKLNSLEGLSGPMSGGSLRNLVFDR